jgi:acetyl esterase/lipase
MHEGDKSGAPVVLIVFAGTAGAFGGIPVIEFFNLVSDIPAYKIFLRDPEALWYQNGIPGIGNSVHDIVVYLKNQCELMGAKRVVTVGNSAGGYAAILFGVLIKADEIHAFSPKTRLLFESDFRDPELLRLLHQKIKTDESSLDLRKFLLQRSGYSATIQVYYAQHEATDARHALRLAGLPKVRLFKYPWAEHGLVRVVKKHGELKRLLSRAVANRPYSLRLITMRSRLLVSLMYMRTVVLPCVMSRLLGIYRST